MKIKLSTALKDLGAPTPFDKQKANFSGMSDQEIKDGLYISKVIHQAIVEVNEEGTEAAAATAVVMMKRCAIIEDIIEFYCDRPFLFFIQEKTTNTVLFLGKFVKP